MNQQCVQRHNPGMRCLGWSRRAAFIACLLTLGAGHGRVCAAASCEQWLEAFLQDLYTDRTNVLHLKGEENVLVLSTEEELRRDFLRIVRRDREDILKSGFTSEEQYINWAWPHVKEANLRQERVTYRELLLGPRFRHERVYASREDLLAGSNPVSEAFAVISDHLLTGRSWNIDHKGHKVSEGRRQLLRLERFYEYGHFLPAHLFAMRMALSTCLQTERQIRPEEYRQLATNLCARGRLKSKIPDWGSVMFCFPRTNDSDGAVLLQLDLPCEEEREGEVDDPGQICSLEYYFRLQPVGVTRMAVERRSRTIRIWKYNGDGYYRLGALWYPRTIVDEKRDTATGRLKSQITTRILTCTTTNRLPTTDDIRRYVKSLSYRLDR